MKKFKNNSIIFRFFIIISVIFSINTLIVIPFKVNPFNKEKLNKNYNSTDFVSEYFYKDFYANIMTGIPSLDILTLLDTRSHYFEFEENYLDRKSLEEIIDPKDTIKKETYDSTKSLSFQNISRFHYSNMELKTATLCSETFSLYTDLSMEHTLPIKDVKFLINDGLKDFDKLNIRLGLNKPLTKEYGGPPHFIQSLLDIKAINDESWTIKFSSKNDGLFILGGEPHTYQDIEKDKKYQRQYYFKTNSLSSIEYHDPLSFSAQKVFLYDNNGEEVILSENKGCYLNYNYGFIIGTKEYREYIFKHFFDKLINSTICSYDFVHFQDYNGLDSRYYAISCDKYKFRDNDPENNYYEKFPNLNFFIFDFNYKFQLTKEDLFTEVNDKLYFMILFTKPLFDHGDLTFWNLGLPFLQKFEFVHNYDKKSIGFYIPYEEEEKEERQKADNTTQEEKDAIVEKHTYKYKVIIIVGAIVAIILIIAAFFIAKNKYQNRKERANELKDEDFDYTSKDKNDNEKEIN